MNSLINNEKGAWVIFLVPFFSGLFFVRQFTLTVLLFAVSSFLVFLGYKPVSVIVRERFITGRITGRYPLTNVIIFVAGITGVGVTAIVLNRFVIFPAGILILSFYLLSLFLLKNKNYRFISDLLGIIGLTGISALLYLLQPESELRFAFFLWMANALFFCGMGLYVYYRIETLAGKAVSKLFTIVTSVYMVFLVCASFFIPKSGDTFVWFIIGLFSPIIHSLIMLSLKKAEKSFRVLGWVLTGYSLIFLFCISKVQP